MSEQNDDKWLDEIISKTINTEKPQFDVEKFKQKFPDEYKILQSRASKKAGYPNLQPNIFRNLITKIAVAAAIILVFGLFIIQSDRKEKIEIPKVTNVKQTPAEMMSVLSINLAYNRGGLQEVDRQYEKAMKELRPRPAQITITELLAESNGT